MHSAQYFLLYQSKFLSSGKLSFAGETGKARQVIDIPLGPPHPVSRVDVPSTARAASAVPSTGRKRQISDFTAWQDIDQSNANIFCDTIGIT